jgi:hypothetical protein
VALALLEASVLTVAVFACTVTCVDAATIFRVRSRLWIPEASVMRAGCGVVRAGAEAVTE